MAHVIYGENRENLIRSLSLWGQRIGSEDFGEVWIQDAKIWLIDAQQAQLLGDHFEYMQAVREGLRPGFKPV